MAAGHIIQPGVLETFELEPPQNCITGQNSLVTSHQSLDYMLDYQVFESFKEQEFIFSPNYRLTAYYSSGTGLCLELTIAGVGRAINHSPAAGL